MKHGIVTLVRNINYGGNLQVLALQQAIKKVRNDVEFETLDFVDDRAFQKLSPRRRLLSFLRGFVANFVGVKRRWERTRKFVKDYVVLSSKRYGVGKGARPLSEANDAYDGFIVGSDQVWRLSNIRYGQEFLLSFANDDKRKIAYAASYGVDSIPSELTDVYSRYLSRFDALSVRESNMAETTERLSGRNVATVLDPTLLLDKTFWEKIAVPPKREGKYVLCYLMPGSRTSNKLVMGTARRAAKILGLPIIWIGTKEHLFFLPNYNAVFDAGPSEFLGYLQNAEYVVTNSFHGTAFAVNFNKKFASVATSIVANFDVSSRITSFLNVLDLNDHIVRSLDDVPSFKEISSASQEKLQAQREFSMNYLREAL